ncbi:hypothetical protein F5884DRAFT_77758 [Xylogone sp. PMI_703]|nr:hypothetical protein F5884DRAFT_77758 [Xylogone sp. PMI_703]
MKFSAIAALCAAPLALAGVLKADVMPRGNEMINVGSKGSGSVVIQETVINEVIIIWVNVGGGATTSTVNAASTVNSAAAAIKTHTVIVGGDAGLVYSPSSVQAAVGDMVVFTFMSQNHTATQSAFAAPCVKLAGGMDSGFMANVNNTVSPPPQMAMQVKVATPIWFYCRQKGHCGKGMTFSINPTAEKTQAMFEQMAIAQNGTGTTPVIAGGAAAATTASVAAAATTAVAAPPPPPAAPAAPPASSGSSSSSSGGSGMVNGSGSMNSDGSCSCSCLCGVSAFPQANQGVGMYGGMSGAMTVAA